MTTWCLVHPKFGLLKRCVADDLAEARRKFGWGPKAVTSVISEASYTVDTTLLPISSPSHQEVDGLLHSGQVAAELGISSSKLRHLVWKSGVVPIAKRNTRGNRANYFTQAMVDKIERAMLVVRPPRKKLELTPEQKHQRKLEQMKRRYQERYAARQAAKAAAERAAS